MQMYCANLISKLREAIKENVRGKSFHTFAVTKAAISKDGFELVGHPTYSSDLVPSDYWLFLKLKEHPHEKKMFFDDVASFESMAEQLFFQAVLAKASMRTMY